MFRKPAFWFVFGVLSILAIVFTVRNFSAAFPLVSLDIRMDRDAAMKLAKTLAEKQGWPPDGFRQAAEFSGDQQTQNFIELEGGGKAELGRILKQRIFAAYTWHVRHFKESDAHETLIRFTPEGDPYGFRVKLPDSEPGASTDQPAAQNVAETSATRDWNFDFTNYKLVESSSEVRPGGRTDHTFVYERQDERLGEGHYRLRLVAAGDKLTELTHFVQIPEAFSRRYEKMRSTNEGINAASTVAMFVFYLLGCCGIGLFFMMRQRWLLWRPALLWAVFIAALMAADQFNSWPLLWMNYDTAVPASGFAIRQIAISIAIFGALAVLLGVSFIAAETLSRRAFPHHIQFWNIWSRPVSSSKPVLAQTVAGYLMVSLFFAYEVILYFFAQGKLGWWTPSDTLVNPNVFASYVPALSAIAPAAQAGFWEECLFRAAPLASAALIGDRFGKRRTFIAAAMVIQTLIFAAGHAGYANQPAYARVVELVIPSFSFGFLYLYFGLLPGIVLHYVFDSAWMTLPLFVSSAPGVVFQQALAVALVLVPLGVVLVSGLRAKRWSETPQEYLNGAWQPSVVEEPVEEPPAAHEASTVSPLVARLLPIVGLIGLVVWIAASDFRTDVPPVSITRAQAEAAARQALTDRGVQLDSSWTVLGRVDGQAAQQDRFVWQKAGRERYVELLGTYLPPPRWHIRFARFQGDVAERAEEYHVYTNGDGRPIRLSHELPEARPGESLPVDEARSIAQSMLTSQFQVPLDAVKEVSAETHKRPARVDWTFEFKDTRAQGLPEGEARIAIEIAGNEIVDTNRYIYVPEEWARNERSQRNLPSIFGVASVAVIVIIVIIGAVVGIIRWSRKRPFLPRAFLVFLGVLFLLSILNLVNTWPTLASQFSTAQPLMLQAAVVASISVVFLLFSAAALGLVAGLVNAGAVSDRPGDPRSPLQGIFAGASAAGLIALARAAGPSTTPQWPGFASASAYFPLLSDALGPLNQFLTQALIVWLVFQAIQRRQQFALLLLPIGVVLAGTQSIETIPSWLVSGLEIGIVLMIANALVFKHHPRLILVAVATVVILARLREGLHQAYPAALPGAIAGSLLIAIVAYLWVKVTFLSVPSPRPLPEGEG